MRKFLKEFGYDLLIFAGIVWFLVDSLMGEDYSHENLAALMTAWFLVMVTWFRATEHKIKSIPQQIHIHLSEGMSEEAVTKTIQRAVDKAHRMR